MRGAPDSEARDTILAIVEDILMDQGYDGLQLREVARRARVSLSRIYKLFGTREELIVAAVERWMAENGYQGLAPPFQEQTVYEGLLQILRCIFEPWETNPRMLEAFHRARRGLGGERLEAQGARAIKPALRWVLRNADRRYVTDVEVLLLNLLYAVFGRFADGELSITDVLPTLERAVFRLSADNTMAVTQAKPRRTGHRK
jgi:TetR/AcrR family transcriptional regulator, cholesterol catabolism regulator